MREHRYRDESGRLTPVCDIPTSAIHEVLRDGIDICEPFEDGENAKLVEARLRLELEIRAMGLSSRREG